MNNDITHEQRAEQVRALFLDVDGTLTDGRLYISADTVYRAFHILDGYGLRRLIAHGILAGLISAAADEGIGKRAQQLGIKHVHTGVPNKLAVVQDILRTENIPAQEAAFMGDDLPDLAAMQHVGFAIAPQTAAVPILAVAHYIPSLPAGLGAVREVCDLILTAQGISPCDIL